jgi:outer membrane protein
MPRILAVLGVLVPSLAHADPRPLTIDEAVSFASAHHPARRADVASERAATYEVDVERARYVPDLELFAQEVRSSANATPGAVFAIPGLPTVMGVPGRVIDRGDWGSAIGGTVSWDLLGFRTWNAKIDRARAEATLAHDSGAASQLEIEYAAADRFIVALERGEAVKATQAGVDRSQVFFTIVKATVGSDLRAGADLSRAEAELAFARTAVIRAEAADAVARADLAEALGSPELQITLVTGRLATAPPTSGVTASRRDPRLLEAEDRARVAAAQRDVIASGIMPKLLLVGALWGRGNGELSGPADFSHGLLPDVPNWAVGVVLAWPVFAGRSVDPASRAQDARIESAHARETEITQELQTRRERATILLDGALRVAETTPLQLRAAREAETQITARYKAQLATTDDVAQAERLLVQAETEDALARLDVWRAVLYRAFVAGDLAPFLAQVHGG